MWIQINENLRRHSFIFLWTDWPYVQTKTVIKNGGFDGQSNALLIFNDGSVNNENE